MGPQSTVAVGTSYYVTVGGPHECYRGDLSKDATWLKTSSGYQSAFTQCTGSTHYYTAAGVKLPGVGTLSPVIVEAATPTSTISPTVSPSATRSPPGTPTGTPSRSATPSGTPSGTPSRSATPSGTPSRSVTPSKSPSGTGTPTKKATAVPAASGVAVSSTTSYSSCTGTLKGYQLASPATDQLCCPRCPANKIPFAPSCTCGAKSRRLSIYDGVYNASLPNATAAMVFGSAVRSQFAALMGVPLPYVIINRAETNCSSFAPTDKPVVDIFSSADPMNSNELFGVPTPKRDEGYFVTIAQGPLQVGNCTTCVAARGPLFLLSRPSYCGGAPTFQPTAFSGSTVSALAAYMNASAASGAFSVATATTTAPSALTVSAAASSAASTVSLTFSISAAGAQAFAAASAPAVLAGVQTDVAAALGVPPAWVTVTIGASAAAAGRRLAATTYSYIAAVAVPSGTDVGTLAALNTGLAAIGSANTTALASVLASTITAFTAENGDQAPTVAAAASVAQNGVACAAPCAVVVPTAAILSTVNITLAAESSFASAASTADLVGNFKADIAASLKVPSSWVTVATSNKPAAPAATAARRLAYGGVAISASIAISDANYVADVNSGLAAFLALSGSDGSISPGQRVGWLGLISDATYNALVAYAGYPTAVGKPALTINGVACATQCAVTLSYPAAEAPFPAGAIAGIAIGAVLLVAAVVACQRHLSAQALAAGAHKGPLDTVARV